VFNKFFALRGNGISLPHIQESTTGTYPKTEESGLHTHKKSEFRFLW